MSDSPVLCDIRQQVATLTFNCAAKHHAFDEDFIAFFTQTLNNLNENPEVQLVVIRSTGKSFSSGADLGWMQRMASFSYDENVADAQKLDDMLFSLASMKAPTMAVVQGACFGGALGLLACCDIVIASDQAQFCFSEVKLGLIPAVISPYVYRATSQRWAQRYFLTAERFSALDALRGQLVHEIVEHQSLNTKADELIKAVRNNGPQALRACVALNESIYPLPSKTIREQTSIAIAKARQGEEAKEGLKAFFAKRTPTWVKHD